MYLSLTFVGKPNACLNFQRAIPQLGMTIWCLLVTNTLLVTRQLRIIQPRLPNQKWIICKIFHNTPWYCCIFFWFFQLIHTVLFQENLTLTPLSKRKRYCFKTESELLASPQWWTSLLTCWPGKLNLPQTQTGFSSSRISFCGLLSWRADLGSSIYLFTDCTFILENMFLRTTWTSSSPSLKPLTFLKDLLSTWIFCKKKTLIRTKDITSLSLY